MQRIRRQSSVNAGIVMIVLGVFIIGMLAAIFIYFFIKEQSIPPKEDDLYPVLVGGNGYYYYEHSSNKGFFSSGLFLAPLLFLLPISAFCIGVGIWNIINGKRCNEVKAKGIKSTCLVKTVVRHIYRRGMPKYSVEVEYQGQSGEKHILSLSFNAYRFEDIKEGERYECLVYQDDCYFDIDNPVQIKDSDIEY